VEYHTGRIDHATQRGAPIAVEFFSDRIIEGGHSVGKAGWRVLSFGYLFANTKKNVSCGFGRRAARMNLE
jgi:hypothetical protein